MIITEIWRSCADELGLIIGSTCVKFENISSHSSTSGESHDIGWIKAISCTEGTYNSKFTYHREDYSSLSSRAISIKFQPPGGIDNPKYEDLTVVAKPYSNPIKYGLNRNTELSYTMRNDSDLPIAYANLSNWIGTSTAVARLKNSCYGNGLLNHFDQYIYHACNNYRGIHIGDGIHECKWDYMVSIGQDIEVYFGFSPQLCHANMTIISPDPAMPSSTQLYNSSTTAPSADEYTSTLLNSTAKVQGIDNPESVFQPKQINEVMVIFVSIAMMLCCCIVVISTLLLHSISKRKASMINEKSEEGSIDNEGMVQRKEGVTKQTGEAVYMQVDTQDHSEDIMATDTHETVEGR